MSMCSESTIIGTWISIIQAKVQQSSMRSLLLCSPWSDVSPKSGESLQLLRKSVLQELLPQDLTMEEMGKIYTIPVLGQAICFPPWKRISSLLECYGAFHGVIPWKRRARVLMEHLRLILLTHKILSILRETSASLLLKNRQNRQLTNKPLFIQTRNCHAGPTGADDRHPYNACTGSADIRAVAGLRKGRG